MFNIIILCQFQYRVIDFLFSPLFSSHHLRLISLNTGSTCSFFLGVFHYALTLNGVVRAQVPLTLAHSVQIQSIKAPSCFAVVKTDHCQNARHSSSLPPLPPISEFTVAVIDVSWLQLTVLCGKPTLTKHCTFLRLERGYVYRR